MLFISCKLNKGWFEAITFTQHVLRNNYFTVISWWQTIIKIQKNQGWNSKISSKSLLFSVHGLFDKTNFPPDRVNKDVTVDHTLLNKTGFEKAQCNTLHTWSWRKAVFCLSEPLLTGDYGILFLENLFVLVLRVLLLTQSILSDKNFFLKNYMRRVFLVSLAWSCHGWKYRIFHRENIEIWARDHVSEMSPGKCLISMSL